jgi:hypothetical protein
MLVLVGDYPSDLEFNTLKNSWIAPKYKENKL